jgi:hypothetical protein
MLRKEYNKLVEEFRKYKEVTDNEIKQLNSELIQYDIVEMEEKKYRNKKIKDIEHDRDYYESKYNRISEENVYLSKRIAEKEKIIENLFNILGNK